MTKPYLQDIDVECWRHVGKLGGSRVSLCLFHSAADRGQPILRALEEMQGEGCGSKRTVTFQPANRQRNILTLRLRYVPESDDLRVMHLAFEGSSATIELTSTGMTVAVYAFAAWLGGAEDFGASPTHADLREQELGAKDRSSAEIWFWGPTYAGP